MFAALPLIQSHPISLAKGMCSRRRLSRGLGSLNLGIDPQSFPAPSTSACCHCDIHPGICTYPSRVDSDQTLSRRSPEIVTPIVERVTIFVVYELPGIEIHA